MGFHSIKTAGLIIVLGALSSASALARNIYLNGTDISSARHQFLQNVSIRIDGNGNVFIEAPHYQVNEENTYMPLSSWNNPATAPKHNAASERPETQTKVGETRELPPVEQTNLNPPPPVATSVAPPANAPAAATPEPPPPGAAGMLEKEGQK